MTRNDPTFVATCQPIIYNQYYLSSQLLRLTLWQLLVVLSLPEFADTYDFNVPSQIVSTRTHVRRKPIRL